jgi:Outer membrane protein beta-barrel domain
MRSLATAVGTMGLAVMAAVPAAAQDRAVTVFARGGGLSSMSDLNDASVPSDFKTGYALGGGAAVQLNRYVALRGDFTFGREEFRDAGVATDDHFNKYIYTGAVQLQYPTTTGITPYAFVGGGGITLKEKNAPSGSPVDKTKGVGVGGLGFSYAIPETNFAVFAEGTGYLYKINDVGGTLAGFDKTQFDVGYTGGVSYRIPF